MKNARAIVTYSVIGLLCVAALAGYLLNKNGQSLPAAPAGGSASAAVSASATLMTSASAGITASGAAAAATAATASPAAQSLNPFARPDGEEHAQAVMKLSATMPGTHVVGIAQGEDYDAVTAKVIENAGGLKEIVKPGSTVVIKPNLITGKPAGSPICTDWRVVQAVANIAKACGAAKVIVAEASPMASAFKMAEYDKIQGVELLDMNKCKKEDCYQLKPEKSLTGQAIYIPKVYMDADVVIGAAKLKTHFQPDAVVSLGLKLSMGVPPTQLYGGAGGKTYLHDMGLKEIIVDLNRIRRPDFVVIDGIVGGEGYGPLSNTPVKSNVMFAGSDIVALDTVALTFMGFKVDEIPHVKLASDEGLGISDLSKITVIGAKLEKIKTRFRRAYE
jgi:uncharacterized protein (DUF362 family)